MKLLIALSLLVLLFVIRGVESTSSCHKCFNTCLERGSTNKRSVCIRRCKAVHCEKPVEKPTVEVEPMSHSDFEAIVESAAADIFEELSDGKIAFLRQSKLAKQCNKCKKECHGKGYKCHATCANKSFCRYEDNAIPVAV